MRKGWMLVGATLLFGSGSVVQAEARSQVMRKIYFVPVRPRVKKQEVDAPGNIRIVFADGRDMRITKTGKAAFNSYHAPRIAPDRRTAAWVEGEYLARNYFAPTSLVIYRNGRTLCRIKGQKAFVEDWFFWNGSKQVALLSRMGHGPATVQLNDATTGRLIQKIEASKFNAKSPAWAKKLGY